MEEEKNLAAEEKAAADLDNSTAEKEAAPIEGEHQGIDFSGVEALSKSEFVPEKWYVSLGHTLAEFLVSALLFLGGFLLDILKALWQVVVGLVFGIKAIVTGIGRFFRGLARIWREGDYGVKVSFGLFGFGNFKVGQIADGIIFLVVEILYLFYMSAVGGSAVVNLIFIGESGRKAVGLLPEGGILTNMDSVRFLILGIFTIIATLAFIYVWYSAIKSAYDGYIIKHNFDFLVAKEDALEVVKNKDKYPGLFTEVNKTYKGREITKLKFISKKAVYKLMRNEYGYPRLSALYISYVDFKRVNKRYPNALQVFFQNIKDGFYARYDKVRNKIRAGKWSNVFAKYLDWKPKAKPSRYGEETVENELSAQINRHRHTYDKYNDYIPQTRDMDGLLKLFDNPLLVEAAIYARDEVSVRNGLEPISMNEHLKPKVAATRIIGAFECSFEDAALAATLYLKKGGLPALEAAGEKLHAKKDAFVEANRTARLASVSGVRKAYTDYEKLRADFDQGKEVFFSTLKNEYGLIKEDADRIYADYSLEIRIGGDETVIKDHLAQRGERYEKLAKTHEEFPFHGQPMHFKRKAKQYLDEKFAVTVMALPVLGALITSIIPLIFSIVIAFTNYNWHALPADDNASLGIFDWSLEGFSKLFSMGNGSIGATFVYILGWTIVWAFFATFLNYILGIVLALMINNKHIKFKGFWRTLFVISIAIPQFITLLGMSKILGDGGPLNTLFYDLGWVNSLSGFWLNNIEHRAISVKITIILVNCWIGIPYTMLSTSGILMNIPEDLYESARIDGASPWTQFWKITMPYILFVTGPSLLTTFIGNINNFNVIYFLTGGGPNDAGTLGLTNNAGMTDLLITWLYKMTVSAAQKQYATGSVLGIVIFAICAFFSLIVYKRMGSTQNEEAFQ